MLQVYRAPKTALQQHWGEFAPLGLEIEEMPQNTEPGDVQWERDGENG